MEGKIHPQRLQQQARRGGGKKGERTDEQNRMGRKQREATGPGNTCRLGAAESVSTSCAPSGRGTQKARRRRQEGAGQRTEAAPRDRKGVTQVCKAHSVPRTDTKKSALNHAESRSETKGKEKTFELPGKKTHNGRGGRNHREMHTEPIRRPRARSKQRGQTSLNSDRAVGLPGPRTLPTGV